MNASGAPPHRGRRYALLALLLGVAAWLRIYGFDWDQGQHLHPDERFLTMVASAVAVPSSFDAFLDTSKSSLNPANRGFGYFTYGTLPLFAVRGIAETLDLTKYWEVHFVGRALSAILDLGTVCLTFHIGARLAGGGVGLFAAALYAFAVPAVQHAHFFTVDSFSTFTATLTVVAALRIGTGAGILADLLFGVAFGAALACRINLLLLGPLYALAVAYATWTRKRGFALLVAGGLLTGITTAVVVRVLQPYAFVGPGFLDVALASAFVNSLETTRSFVRGDVDFPPSVQWIGRVPLLFATRNLLGWGLGPAWGIAAAIGVLWCLSLRRRATNETESRGIGRIVALWAIGFFVYHATQFAPTLRYFLAIVPLLAVFAAWWLAGGGRFRASARAVVLLATALWAFAFTAIYRRPHSRVVASQWIYANVAPGSVVANEHWDDGLPLSVDGHVSSVYESRELKLFDDDTSEKRQSLIQTLTETDYLLLTSNRLYGTIPRAPWRYPLGRAYYELLFAGKLGFRLEKVFSSYPRLGPFEIPDDGAEEAFTVYDHPKVLIFRKTDEFSRERVERLLGAVPLDGIVRVPPREASALYRRFQPSDVSLPGEEKVRSAVAAVPGGGSIAATIRWLVGLELAAVACLLLLAGPFARLPDRGLGFAHIVAWLVPGYAAWLGGALGFGANQPESLRRFLAALVAVGLIIAARRGRELTRSIAAARTELLFVASLFFAGFALFASLRALNPAVFWGEKPMDFAILNAILRSGSMPPADPWWAGGTLNYYYYGHEVVAAFAALTGVAPAFAFNLAIATTGALMIVAAYTGGRLVLGRVSGLLAAVGAALIGNLEGLWIWLADPARGFNFDTYWATTRLWSSSINEYPWWNILFGDLHSHVLAQPISLATAALGTLWVADDDGSRRAPRWLLFVLVAWLGGALAVTSTWSLPVAFAAQLAFLLTDAVRGPRRTIAIGLAVLLWISLGVISRLLYLPFWLTYERPAFGWGFETDVAPIDAVFRHFGVFFIAIVPGLVLVVAALVKRRPGVGMITLVAASAAITTIGIMRSPAAALYGGLALLALVAWSAERERAVRSAAALAFVAAAVGCGTEIVFVSDRMNTVFKFYLEMWLLFAVAAGVLVPLAFARLGLFGRLVFVLPLGTAVCAAIFTAATGAFGWARSPMAPSPIPTLDGMAYLERTRPEELEAYRWLNHEVVGVPVLLEAQGPSYQEFGRVSMNTGLPIVLGWEWHLTQQGHDRGLIEERKDDIAEIYSTPSAKAADVLLRKYGVALVFVGPLERKTYPPAGLVKFAEPGWLDVVFRNEEVTIYGRPGAVDATRTWIQPARETKPFREAPLGRMREPRDLATAPDGTVVIADFGNRRIQRLTADRQAVATFGHEGELPGEFRDPCGVAVARDGRIFVADTWNHRVQVFSAEGEPIAQWAAGFYGPRGIALAPDGTLFVTDTGNRSVVRLGPEGQVLARFGKDVLKSPIGIAIDAKGEVWVADPERREVVIFDAAGTKLRSFAVDGWQPSGTVEPYLEIGKDGVAWLTDPPGARVLLYDRDGKQLGVAVAESTLNLPFGIALVDDRRALVSSGDKVIAVKRP